jgi:hypothetical protein
MLAHGMIITMNMMDLWDVTGNILIILFSYEWGETSLI